MFDGLDVDCLGSVFPEDLGDFAQSMLPDASSDELLYFMVIMPATHGFVVPCHSCCGIPVAAAEETLLRATCVALPPQRGTKAYHHLCSNPIRKEK